MPQRPKKWPLQAQKMCFPLQQVIAWRHRRLNKLMKDLIMEQLNRIELRGVVANVKTQAFSENKMARLTLVTNYAYKDKEGAAVIDTSWHSVVAWEGRYVHDVDKIMKGDKVFVQGRLRYQKYTGSDGAERVTTDIVAARVVVIEDPEPLSYEM